MNYFTTTARGQIVVREIPYPASSLAVFKSIQHHPNCFFLDSALLKDDISRYSFMGYQPFLTLKAKGSHVKIQTNYNSVKKHVNPFTALRSLLKRFRLETNNLPVPFAGGAVGYLAYDLCHFIERLPATKPDDVGFPDMYFGFYDTVIAFDHVLNKCYIIAIDFDEDCQPYIQEKRPPAEERVEQILQCGISSEFRVRRSETPNSELITSNFTSEEYMEMVRCAKEYIAAGDIYQVNLSQRFKTQISIPPHELYLKLREINPAPFACYLQFDDMAIASSSPERFLRVSKGCHVQTRPIKGTRPRCTDEKDDLQMKYELLSSPKENAELTMIVDLERNDLGRVCNYGSVKVVQKKALESHPTVYHLVATIEGDLHERYDIIDLIKATFPGGSITGAPKIRAMQIIDELEPTRRGVYTGAIGYIGFNDCIDLNIAIRTFLIKGSEAYFQVGGGIVADSDPEKEFEETLHKARALILAHGS
ncbi:MAG TPA: aminodeoxychorismate synthase component I [Candidatus Brocadiales bacterium]|nr:aminodeoxychorismate synthase component I [Candidatus Brocadiales bacterium]